MSERPRLALKVIPETLAVCRLAPEQEIPAWALGSPFFSISKTNDELSVVCAESLVPVGVACESSWRAFQVKGPLDFGLTGILASIAEPLAQNEISIFAISTFDTDYILVKTLKFAEATLVLTEVGHHIEN